jgi:predicted secreted protein
MPGAGGTRHFLLLVNHAGKGRVTLQYGRWWKNGERQPAKTFTIEATKPASQ